MSESRARAFERDIFLVAEQQNHVQRAMKWSQTWLNLVALWSERRLASLAKSRANL